MEVVRLKDLLEQHFSISEDMTDSGSLRDRGTISAVNQQRNREMTMRKSLHPGLVRRLDAGFGRSNTVHPDTGNALYTLCYVTPTQNVFETGTYWGFSTAYLAAALQDKGAGKVYTFDIYDKAGKHIPRNVLSHVEMYRGKSSIETMPEVLKRIVPELFFQDSRHDYEGVAQELEVITPFLKQGAIILFHDFVAPEVQQAATDVLKDYRICVLDTQDPQQLGFAIKVSA